MKQTLAIYILAFLSFAQVQISSGIVCYSCKYVEGDESSSQTCRDNPTEDETEDFSPKAWVDVNGTDTETEGDAREYYPCCLKINVRKDGKEVVQRFGLHVHELPEDANRCWDGPPFGLAPEEDTVFEKGCTCTGFDLCNSAMRNYGSCLTLFIFAFLAFNVNL